MQVMQQIPNIKMIKTKKTSIIVVNNKSSE